MSLRYFKIKNISNAKEESQINEKYMSVIQYLERLRLYVVWLLYCNLKLLCCVLF